MNDPRSRVIEGDMLKMLRRVKRGTVDACICDPPYHLASIVKRFGADGAAPAQHGTDGAFARLSRGFVGKRWDGGDIAFRRQTWRAVARVLKPGAHVVAFGSPKTSHRMTAAMEEAGLEIREGLVWLYGTGQPRSHPQKGEWEGWGTGLKTAHEPITVARKPLRGTVARNLAQHGVGALHIAATRQLPEDAEPEEEARFPSNVLHDGSPAVLGALAIYGEGLHRLFYSPKAGPDERCGSTHPTVKPHELLRWLVRLVTPPGGLVLDPFAGTGTTGEAALREGMRCVMIEADPEYAEDIRRRLERAGVPDPWKGRERRPDPEGHEPPPLLSLMTRSPRR